MVKDRTHLTAGVASPDGSGFIYSTERDELAPFDRIELPEALKTSSDAADDARMWLSTHFSEKKHCAPFAPKMGDGRTIRVVDGKTGNRGFQGEIVWNGLVGARVSEPPSK